MTVLRIQSMTEALDDGATDGKYRKRRPNTRVYPGDGDQIVMRERAGLEAAYNYGFINQEVGDKVNPGGL